MTSSHATESTPAAACFDTAAQAGKRQVAASRRALLKRIVKLLAACALWPTGSRAEKPERRLKWVAFYGLTADERMLAAYDIVILDRAFQGSIDGAAKAGARVCGYLSLGEIRTADGAYGRLDRDALLEENRAWPGTRRIDVRHPSWRRLVLTEIIPSIAARRFTGLMLDTLDTPPWLEQQDPGRFGGMGGAAVDLVQAIREFFPEMMLIMNRGYALLPAVVGSIDAIIAESLLTVSDERKSGGYRWNEPSQVALQLSLLAPARQQGGGLPVLSLDYWDPADIGTIREIYAREHRLGHYPYVATRTLDRVVSEPSS